MEYRAALRFLIERSGYEKGFVANPFAGDDVAARGLRRTAALLEQLGRPQERYPIIHVAGTKGKGSTCATIAQIAQATGSRTGLYATPHLHTFRERIQITNQPVDESTFASLMTKVVPACREAERSHPELGECTAFEISTALALLAFADASVDVAVVEVGLGGRLDATNVVDPAVSVITSISFDHTAILGDSLGQIAQEKGGIIKAGRPVVIGPQPAEAMNCLRQLARERGVPAYIAGDHWRTDASGRLDGPWGDWRDVRLSLAGPHQVENTGVALMALWVFEPALLADERRVRATLESISWPGRFELVAEHPRTWADGAHNVDSILRLIETIRHENASQPMVVIVGIARDKDAAGMLRALATLPAKLIVTASTNPRALTTRELSETAYSLGIAHETAPNVDDALARARELATPNGSVIATGSLHVVAELREALGLATTPVFERELLYG